MSVIDDVCREVEQEINSMNQNGGGAVADPDFNENYDAPGQMYEDQAGQNVLNSDGQIIGDEKKV